MKEWIILINDAIWTYVLIGVLVSCGIWFTWKTHGVQFRMIGEMFRLLDDYRQQKRAGIKEPVFHKKLLPEIEHELTCWD